MFTKIYKQNNLGRVVRDYTCIRLQDVYNDIMKEIVKQVKYQLNK